jgi:hypothetical protein
MQEIHLDVDDLDVDNLMLLLYMGSRLSRSWILFCLQDLITKWLELPTFKEDMVSQFL